MIILFCSILYYLVLFYSVLFVMFTVGISSREVEYQISNPKDVSLIPIMVTAAITLLFFLGKTFGNFRKTSGNFQKPPENLRKIPKMAERYGNANVFTRPTNRKHFPLHGQFGFAASDYMYGNQRPEFYQYTVVSLITCNQSYK